MSLRVVILALLPVLCVACSPAQRDRAAAEAAAPPAPVPERVVAYYFHGAIRCVTCLEIERIVRETVETRLVEDVAAGTLQWQAIDYDIEENGHYQDRYELSMPSLVLVRFRGDEQLDWIALEETWARIADGEELLAQYVEQEVQIFMRRAP